MYIRKKDIEIIEKMDKAFKIPKDFEKFIYNTGRLKLGLIIKSGNNHKCLYCNNVFKSTIRVNNKETCPKCHNIFLVKGSNIQRFMQEMDVGILDRLDNQFVVRLFRVYFYYSNEHYSYEYREYCRSIIDGKTFLNSCFQRGMFWEKVYIQHSLNKWRVLGDYQIVNTEAIFYYKNLKKLLIKYDEYKYSMIWDLVKHTPTENIYMPKLLQYAREYSSMELLIKLKLYNLALYANNYNKKGSFEDRFGVPKEYYNFMKKYNIKEEELIVLRLIKKKDIKLIRTLTETFNIYKLIEFSKITKVENLLKYQKIAKHFDFDLYLDYLENAKVLGYDLKDKMFLFPEDLEKSHDFVVEQVKVNGGPLLDKSVQNRYIELNNNTYKNNVYIIRPPKDKKDFMDEANQQKNCVYTNYYSKHAKYKTDIYFMRNLENPDKSLVTVEVLNNKIVQKRRKCREQLTKAEISFLEKWEQNVLKGVA